jgi:hypothetical protein
VFEMSLFFPMIVTVGLSGPIAAIYLALRLNSRR